MTSASGEPTTFSTRQPASRQKSREPLSSGVVVSETGHRGLRPSRLTASSRSQGDEDDDYLIAYGTDNDLDVPTSGVRLGTTFVLIASFAS